VNCNNFKKEMREKAWKEEHHRRNRNTADILEKGFA
jgi:hypothetical protein